MASDKDEADTELLVDLEAKIHRLQKENGRMRKRIMELEYQLADKTSELEHLAEKYREKQWRHFEFYSRYSDLNPTEELSAHLILDLREEVEDLKPRCEMVILKSKDAHDQASSVEEECSRFRGLLEKSTKAAAHKLCEMSALRDLLKFRKEQLEQCRKRADRIFCELKTTRRALAGTLLDSEIRDRTILMLSGGKDNAQLVMDLTFRADELKRKVEELENKIAEVNAAREELELLSSDRKTGAKSPKKVKVSSKQPAVGDLLTELEERKISIDKLKRQLGKELADKEVMKEAVSEATNSYHKLTKEDEQNENLLLEVMKHVTQSAFTWEDKISEHQAARSEAKIERARAVLPLHYNVEHLKLLERQLSAQAELISYLQVQTVPGNVQLKQELREWLPPSLEMCLGQFYYAPLLAAARLERERLISMLRKATDDTAAQQSLVHEAQAAFIEQRRCTKRLQQQLELAKAAAGGKMDTCPAMCSALHQGTVDVVQADIEDLRNRCEELRRQNAENLQAALKHLELTSAAYMQADAYFCSLRPTDSVQSC